VSKVLFAAKQVVVTRVNDFFLGTMAKRHRIKPLYQTIRLAYTVQQFLIMDIKRGLAGCQGEEY
jgi:hypothetical protein